MPRPSTLYEITSLVTRSDMPGKAVIEMLMAVTPETVTITFRDARGSRAITVSVARDQVAELPEAMDRAMRQAS